MRIGVLCALEVESRPLAAEISVMSQETVAGTHIERGAKHGHDIFLCTFGVGPTAAAAAAQLLISQYRCSAIIIAGAAGNTDTLLPIGGAVIGKRVLFHDFDMEILSHYSPYSLYYESGERLVGYAKAACEALRIEYTVGTVATGNEFVCNKAKAMEIAHRTGCSCVEMESAAAAQVAAKNGASFLAVRVMSDNADEDIADLKKVIDMPYQSYAEESAAIVVAILKKIM